MKNNSNDVSQLPQARNTFLAVECPHCGIYNERRIEWLNDATSFACDACKGMIDIASGQYRAVIDALLASMTWR